MANYLITGSSRGLGLALASGLAASPASQIGTVFATARQDNSPQLRELIDKSAGRVGFVQLDVNNTQSIQEAVKSVEGQLQGKGLDVLINNAGIMPITPGGLEAMYVYFWLLFLIIINMLRRLQNRDKLNETFDMNVTSVHNVTRAFLPLLRKSQKKTVVNMYVFQLCFTSSVPELMRNSSTTLGSIGLAGNFAAMPAPEYKITKAALNMLTVQYAQACAKEGFTIFSISPGVRSVSHAILWTFTFTPRIEGRV